MDNIGRDVGDGVWNICILDRSLAFCVSGSFVYLGQLQMVVTIARPGTLGLVVLMCLLDDAGATRDAISPCVRLPRQERRLDLLGWDFFSDGKLQV